MIMKKYFSFLIILLFLILSLCSCGHTSECDLSTPSSRLVGHWVADTPLRTEYYIGKIDPKTGKGTITAYLPDSGSFINGIYAVTNEISDGENITLDVVWEDKGEVLIDYVVGKDGKSASMQSSTINYIDSNTKP
jgi:hypothetical protein